MNFDGTRSVTSTNPINGSYSALLIPDENRQMHSYFNIPASHQLNQPIEFKIKINSKGNYNRYNAVTLTDNNTAFIQIFFQDSNAASYGKISIGYKNFQTYITPINWTINTVYKIRFDFDQNDKITVTINDFSYGWFDTNPYSKVERIIFMPQRTQGSPETDMWVDYIRALDPLYPLMANAGGPYSGQIGETILFFGSAIGGLPPYTYEWDFDNDGAYDDSSMQNPTKTWNSAGTFTIRLKVEDIRGVNTTDSALVNIIGNGQIICDKTIRDSATQQWVNQANAHIGDTIRFKITLTYTGSGDLSNIRVKDTLPVCLSYADNANPVPTGISGNKIFWNISTVITNGQSFSIEFDTTVISAGTNMNVVSITGLENDVTPLNCEDTATVIVSLPPSLVCEKKVRDPITQQWVDQINANVGGTIRFKITFSYSGQLSFYNIWVTDNLPLGLQYADNANIPATTIVGNTIKWYLPIQLHYGDSYSIEFDAKVKSSGTNINVANINGIEFGVRPLYCEDTASVICRNSGLKNHQHQSSIDNIFTILFEDFTIY